MSRSLPWFLDSANRVNVAIMSDEVIGCIQVTEIPDVGIGRCRLYVEHVRVAAALAQPGHRRDPDAVAHQLCRGRDCATVQLLSNQARADAHRFYDRLGFQQTHFGYKLHL